MADSVKNQFNQSTLNNPIFSYGEKKIYKHLTPPPLAPEVFLGREDDLEQVREKLFQGENLLLLVNGRGGI